GSDGLDPGKVLTEELIEALFRKDTEVAKKMLLSEGSSIIEMTYGITKPENISGHDTIYTPLHVAVLIGDVEIARMLLEKGASPDVMDNPKREGSIGRVSIMELFLG